MRRWLEPVRYLPFALGRPRSPRTITIDPLARCNLACPLCPTGRGHQHVGGKGILSLALYCKILDQLPRLRTLRLWNWGEPLIHPQIDEIIAIAAPPRDRRARAFAPLAEEGRRVLRAADRRGPHLALGVDSTARASRPTRAIASAATSGSRSRTSSAWPRPSAGSRSKTPRIVWKFIVHRHNAHEVETARRMAREIGVEFATAPIGLADDLVDYAIGESLEERRREWLPDDPAARAPAYRDDDARRARPIYEGRCTHLFESPVISPAGDVMPCCYATHPGNAFGNLERTLVRRDLGQRRLPLLAQPVRAPALGARAQRRAQEPLHRLPELPPAQREA